MKKYIPPKQSAFGQIIDSLVVLALVVLTLLASLFVTIHTSDTGPSGETSTAAVATVAGSPEVEAAKAERFRALGWDEKKVQERQQAVASKSYSINWPLLIITTLVIIGYFVFMIRASDKELREIIKERFDSNQ